MELSGPTVDELLRIAEQRLSQNSSSRPAHSSDQSDTAARQPTVDDGSKLIATAGLEPRVVSAKATQKVSDIILSLCCPNICFCRMMRTYLTSDAEGEPVLGLVSAPKHDVSIS